jgi:hypothetical protein
MKRLPRRLEHGEEATLVEHLAKALPAVPTIRMREFLAHPSAPNHLAAVTIPLHSEP